jgi:hypothetical protein
MIKELITRRWNNFKWFVKEVVKTFSNKPSFFSSKRIERAIIFVNANIMLDLMTWHLLKTEKIDYIAAVAIYAAQMVYAGYQTKQIFKDKTDEPKPEEPVV